MEVFKMCFNFLVRFFFFSAISYLPTSFSMDPPPSRPGNTQQYEASVFLSSCASLSNSVYETLNIEPIKISEIKEKINQIGCGDPNYDLGLFQAQLYIDFHESLNNVETNPIQLDRTRAYILKKIQEMLCDFSIIISKGKSYLENESEREYIRKHMEKAKNDFDLLLAEFKAGRTDLIKPKILEYFGLKLSFLADLAENPSLHYGVLHNRLGIMNSLEGDTKDKIEKLRKVLDSDYDHNILIIELKNIDFWKPFSLSIDKILDGKRFQASDEFSNKTIPIYSSRGLIGIHTFVYCILKGYFPIAISPITYPVHANMFRELRISTIDHDYQHFFDTLQKTKIKFYINTDYNVTAFYPPVFNSLSKTYEKSMLQNDVEERKKDLILLFSFLHEKPDFSKGTAFFYDMRNFLDRENDRRRHIYINHYDLLRDEGLIQQNISQTIFEAIGYVDLLKTIGVNINFNFEGFELPENLEETVKDEMLHSNIQRIAELNENVAKNLNNLWAEFKNKYATELQPMKDINPDMFRDVNY